MGLVIPAALPSSRKNLEEELELFSRIPSVSPDGTVGVNRVQIDVVDGRFASPASWPYSPPSPKATEGHSAATKGKPSELEIMAQNGEMLPYLDHFEYEIDLMCIDAENAAEAWLALGATRLIFHAESATDILRLLISARRRYGVGGLASLIHFGLALNIASDLALVEPCLGEIEFVQFMGITQIGRQRQPFNEHVLGKIRIFKARHPKFPIQVDGGISLNNAKRLIALGVSNLVVGSAIARASDPIAAVAAFEKLRSPYCT